MANLSNLPPGCSVSDIPGNRPEDIEWDYLYDWITDTGISAAALRELVRGWCKRHNPAALNRPPK